MTDQTQVPGEKLYAGKFPTVEALEEGYKNAAPVYDENQKLKSQLVELTTVPADYLIPGDVKLGDAEVNEVKRIAKNSQLSQQHFDKLIRETHQYGQNKHQQFEEIKKSLGQETLNVLQDYVKNNYPEKLQQNILTNLIEDKEAREAALVHRQLLLNTTTPGMKAVSSGIYHVTEKEVLSARDDVQKSRGTARISAQKRYLGLLEKLAAQNKKE